MLIVHLTWLAKREPVSAHALDCFVERMPSVRLRTTTPGVDAESDLVKDGMEIVFHVS